MDYHKWLYRTRWLMKEVECAVCNLSEHIVSDGVLPNLFYSGESDAATIILKSDELRQKLRGVYYCMADEWPVICANEVKRHEAAIHLRDYSRLKSRFRELTALVETDPSLNTFLFNDENLLQRLDEFFTELDFDMEIILIALSDEQIHIRGPMSCLVGIAERMRKFLPDMEDTFFEKLILKRELPPKPVAWHGQKADCARFLQHFGFTDELANRIFYCIKDGKRLKKLKISSDIGRKGDDSYPVMAILKDYPFIPE